MMMIKMIQIEFSTVDSLTSARKSKCLMIQCSSYCALPVGVRIELFVSLFDLVSNLLFYNNSWFVYCVKIWEGEGTIHARKNSLSL